MRTLDSAGLTQDVLARKADTERVVLVQLEKSDQTPGYKILDAIAKTLGISVSELLVEPMTAARGTTLHCHRAVKSQERMSSSFLSKRQRITIASKLPSASSTKSEDRDFERDNLASNIAI